MSIKAKNPIGHMGAVSRIGKRLRGDNSSVATIAGNLRLSRTDDSAKPITRQLIEMAKLRVSRTRLSPTEYQLFRLHDSSIYGDRDLSAICGSRMRLWLHEQLNNPSWDAVVSDKINMSMIFDQAGIPQPELHAVFSRFDRAVGSVPVLRSRGELNHFLTTNVAYPIFVKPVKGGSGAGCHRVEELDRSSGDLLLGDGRRLDVEGFVDQLFDGTGWGFIVQQAMLAAPETRPIAADKVTGIRMLVLLDDDRPRLFRATWKIPGAECITDNFGDGDKGTTLAHIDIEDGRADRIIHGMGLEMQMNQPHPATGAQIHGRRVPGWDRAVSVTLGAARAFPGFRFQHWDLGLTSQGPVVFELNTAGALFDMGSRTGTYDEELRRFVKQHQGKKQHAGYHGSIPA